MPRNLQVFFSRSAATHPDHRARIDELRDALVRRIGEREVTWSTEPLDLARLTAGTYEGLFYFPVLTATFADDEGCTTELAAVLQRAHAGSTPVHVVPLLLEDSPAAVLDNMRDLRSWWASGAAVSEAAPLLDEIGAWMTIRIGQFGDDDNWDLAEDVSAVLSLPSPRPEPLRVFVPNGITKVPVDQPPTVRTFVEDDVLVTEESDTRGTVRFPAPLRPARPYRRRRSVSPTLAIGGLVTLALGSGAALWQWRPAPFDGTLARGAVLATPSSPLAITPAEGPPAAPAPATGVACGNGKPDPGEECDFGTDYNRSDPGGCTATCRLPWQEVPAGTYWLGSSPTRESERGIDEPWARPVASAAFQILPTEVTAAQRARFGAPTDGDAPLAEVTWHEASAFCADVGARLPTEAEWEAAARVQKRTRWSCGNDPDCLRERAWFAHTSGHHVHPVATRTPNELGLYDMEGNLWEWVQDCYYPAAYRIAEIDDAQRYATFGACNWRVVRGGSYRSAPDLLRSAFRARREPETSEDSVGFRCVKGPEAAPYPAREPPKVALGS